MNTATDQPHDQNLNQKLQETLYINRGNLKMLGEIIDRLNEAPAIKQKEESEKTEELGIFSLTNQNLSDANLINDITRQIHEKLFGS